jgi:hypothetical protein
MLIEFTPVAINYGYLDRARKYATRLRRYKAELSRLNKWSKEIARARIPNFQGQSQERNQ